jgi:hypothetical protein
MMIGVPVDGEGRTEESMTDEDPGRSMDETKTGEEVVTEIQVITADGSNSSFLRSLREQV